MFIPELWSNPPPHEVITHNKPGTGTHTGTYSEKWNTQRKTNIQTIQWKETNMGVFLLLLFLKLLSLFSSVGLSALLWGGWFWFFCKPKQTQNQQQRCFRQKHLNCMRHQCVVCSQCWWFPREMGQQSKAETVCTTSSSPLLVHVLLLIGFRQLVLQLLCLSLHSQLIKYTIMRKTFYSCLHKKRENHPNWLKRKMLKMAIGIVFIIIFKKINK